MANARSANVSAYSIATNGALTPILGSPFTTGGFPWSVAVDPTGKFAYVTNQGDHTVSAYSIAADGSLTVPGRPFATGTLPESVVVYPSGKFAYVANSGSDNVSAYSVRADGALTPAGSPIGAGSFPISVAITRFVPFTSSFAQLEIAKGSFDLNEYFSLGANSSGIKPLKENVTLQIGTFSILIPAGSFQSALDGSFAFKGIVDGVILDARIVPLGYHDFQFEALGTGVDLTGLTNPVSLVLTIGTNIGATPVIAQFK